MSFFDIDDAQIAALLAEIEAIDSTVEPEAKPGYFSPIPPDLSRYRFSCHVDTILIEIETEQPCKRPALLEATGSNYARSLDKESFEDGHGSCRWYLKLEDPTIDSVDLALDTVRKRWNLTSEDPAIVWIDIALDARLKGLDSRRNPAKQNAFEAYEPLFALWLRSLKPDCSRRWPSSWCSWRYVGYQAGMPMPEDIAFPEYGVVAYVGEVPDYPDAPLTSEFYRMYWKFEDMGQTLDATDCRARLECRIGRGGLDAVGLRTVADLSGFRWRKFADWFRFADPRNLPTPVVAHHSTIMQLGLPVRYDARSNRLANDALSRIKL